MLELLAGPIDIILKLFVLGLFVSMILNWVNANALTELQHRLNQFYDIFLGPLRQVIKPIPIRLPHCSPMNLDITPLLLLLVIVIFVHPLLMWIFS